MRAKRAVALCKANAPPISWFHSTPRQYALTQRAKRAVASEASRCALRSKRTANLMVSFHSPPIRTNPASEASRCERSEPVRAKRVCGTQSVNITSFYILDNSYQPCSISIAESLLPESLPPKTLPNSTRPIDSRRVGPNFFRYIRLRMHLGLMKTVNYEINGVEGVIRTVSHTRSGHRTKSCLLSAQKERILKGRALRVDICAYCPTSTKRCSQA